MAKRALTFRQGDVVRAIKAAREAGLPIGSVEVGKDGLIRITSGEGTVARAATQ